jgi:predicted nucleic acid-binding protein
VAVVLDSSAVVGFLDAGDALHPAADATIRELISEQRLLASVVSYAELLTGARIGHHDEELVEGFFTDLITEVLPVDMATVDIAARLRACHKALRLPDALILASAEGNPEVEMIVSGDATVAKAAGLGCKVHLLL